MQAMAPLENEDTYLQVTGYGYKHTGRVMSLIYRALSSNLQHRGKQVCGPVLKPRVTPSTFKKGYTRIHKHKRMHTHLYSPIHMHARKHERYRNIIYMRRHNTTQTDLCLN